MACDVPIVNDRLTCRAIAVEPERWSMIRVLRASARWPRDADVAYLAGEGSTGIG